jgi:hypothetical protein
MFELLDYVAFVVAGLAGVGVGRRMRPRPPAPLRPICTCKHGFGHHEKGKRCHGTEENYRNGTTYLDPCGCQCYDGPDPSIFGLDPKEN